MLLAVHAGHLSAELRNANGNVPVDVARRDRDRYAVSFVPLVEGTTDRIWIYAPLWKAPRVENYFPVHF